MQVYECELEPSTKHETREKSVFLIGRFIISIFFPIRDHPNDDDQRIMHIQRKSKQLPRYSENRHIAPPNTWNVRKLLG